MNKINRDGVLTTIAIILLLFTAVINWNIYSWLVLLAIIIILFVRYSKK